MDTEENQVLWIQDAKEDFSPIAIAAGAGEDFFSNFQVRSILAEGDAPPYFSPGGQVCKPLSEMVLRTSSSALCVKKKLFRPRLQARTF